MLAPSQDRLEAATRVKRWTRARFALGSHSPILVAELESAQPGFPPLTTVVSFWDAEQKHYHWRIFKPLQEVVEDDLPPAWYREALEVSGGLQCGCC
jgi:nitrate reductase delta subunit